MTTPNPGGDGELLRDAIADEVERNFGFFGSLHGKAIPVGRETYLDIGAVAVAALRTVLREHPEAIAGLLPPEDNAEARCQRCGLPNVLGWFVANDEWNAAVDAEHRSIILCPRCFVEAWERATGILASWELKLETPSGPFRQTLAGRNALRAFEAWLAPREVQE